MKNEYQHLLKTGPIEDQPCVEYNVEQITSSKSETILIFTSEIVSGRWAVGYRVFWANGRSSYLMPSLSNGWFSSENHAKLYILGFMKMYLPYFLESTKSDILAALSKHSQTFLDL